MRPSFEAVVDNGHDHRHWALVEVVSCWPHGYWFLHLLAVVDATFLGIRCRVWAEMLAKTKHLQLPLFSGAGGYLENASGIDRAIAFVKNVLESMLIKGAITSGIII